MKDMDYSAVILAGGENKRMGGRDKAMLHVGEKAIIKRIIDVLEDIFPEIYIVANNPRKYEYEHTNVIRDKIKNAGPLGGIHSALCAISGNAAFFVACDMPFLHNAVIRRQLSEFEKSCCDCMVARMGKHIEPLHAIYKKKLKDDIHSFLMNNSERSIRGFLKTIDTGYMDLDKDSHFTGVFMNINSPEDLEKAKGHYENKIQGLA